MKLVAYTKRIYFANLDELTATIYKQTNNFSFFFLRYYWCLLVKVGYEMNSSALSLICFIFRIYLIVRKNPIAP